MDNIRGKIGDRDVAFQESAVADLIRLGQVSGYPLDVTDRESFATFLDKARTDGGGHIDVLINNAGVCRSVPSSSSPNRPSGHRSR